MWYVVFLQHPFIKPQTVELRLYQENIAKTAMKKNTLVVLPTGLGKTIIALLVLVEELKKSGNKILFLSPTKPLVSQHTQFLQNILMIDDNISMFTGELSPEKRKVLWESSRIIVSTPQVIENDLISRRLHLQDVSLIIFDEAHRAVGNYSYIFVANMYHQQREKGHVLGMTASPGNDLSKILEVCENLRIGNIEIRSKYDRDVRPYVYELHMQWKEIPLPQEFSQVIQLLRKALVDRLKILKDTGIIDSVALNLVNRTKLLEMQQKIQGILRSTPNSPPQFYQAASAQNAALKLYHGIELLQTQGVKSFLNYMQRIGHEATSRSGSKAARDIMKDVNVLEAFVHAKSLQIEHPKIPVVIKILRDQLAANSNSRTIIFTQYRDTASSLLAYLENEKIPSLRAIKFIGQAGKINDKGLTQKEQIEIIKKFRQGIFNVLIATSVAEEGLDIPSTDLVIFYEPVPSEIRTIQRRGRTARKMPGKVIILITKGTPDEAYYWSARRKERIMQSELEILRSALHKKIEDSSQVYKQIAHQMNAQKKIEEYQQQNQCTIIVDHRESRSEVIRYLVAKNVKIETNQLAVGDYVLSSRLGVERKTVDDFLNSLLSGKLFAQIRALREGYSRPILIIEGEGLLTKRNINHNALFGSIVSIIVDFGVAIITTASAQETADLLNIMASREQKEGDRAVAVRGEKIAMSFHEQQRFIVEGLPHISAVLAERLLQHFGSIRAIVNATEEDLCAVPGIGKNIAAEIVKILNNEYN